MAKEGFFLDFQGERRRLAPFKGILRSSRLGAAAPHLASNAAAVHRQNGGITTPQARLTSFMTRTAPPAIAAAY